MKQKPIEKQAGTQAEKQVEKDPETERFYKISYFIIPIPIIAGLIFAAYVLITEDSRNEAFCVTAKSESNFLKMPLEKSDFISLDDTTLDVCKDKDDDIDDGDGYKSGKVRWFVCKGTSCGKGWETILSQK